MRDAQPGLDALVRPDAAPVDPPDAGVPAPIARTISAIQDRNDPGHPATGCVNNGTGVMGQCARAELQGVVVTAVGGYINSTLRALWIQDPGDADGRFAAVKIIYTAANPGVLPQVGEVIDVSGQIIEFYGATQVQFATLTLSGTFAPIAPRVVQPALVSRSAVATASEYEGTLVRLLSPAVEVRCIDDDQLRDFGYFTVTGDVLIGTAFQYGYNGMLRPSSVMCLDANMTPTGLCSCSAMSRPNDMRATGDRFASITGMVDYVLGQYQIQPRSADDLVR